MKKCEWCGNSQIQYLLQLHVAANEHGALSKVAAIARKTSVE